MPKKVIVLVWLALLLTLSGCGAKEEQAAVPLLVEYRGLILNTEGQVIVERPEDYNIDNAVLYDRWANPRYAVQREEHFVAEQAAQYLPDADSELWEFESGAKLYDSYSMDRRSAGRTLRFYDCYGELLHTVDIVADLPSPRHLRFYFSPDGDLTKSVFMLDELEEKGRYQLFDYAGNLLAEKQGLVSYGGAALYLASDFVAMRYSVAEGDLAGENIDFYALDGTPLPTAHQYFDFDQLHFYNTLLEDRPLFYQARYTNEENRRRYDILDGAGNVVVGNLTGLKLETAGIYFVTRDWGDSASLWLDLRSGQPVWLEEEPAEVAQVHQFDEESHQPDKNFRTEKRYDNVSQMYRYVYYDDDYAYGYYGYYSHNYDWFWSLSPYYMGIYYDDFRGDVLDGQGNVLFSDVASYQVDYAGNDVFIMQQGFSRGLMNTKGEWLYQESIFDDWAD